MIASIAIRGFGPHESTRLEFDPSGITELSGPSESGKSTSLEAVCLCLFGTGSDGKPSHTGLVRDGHRRAEIEIRPDDGRTLRRARTAGGQMQRTFADGNGERTYTREEDWRSALGELGAYAEPARVVMAPFAWVELSRGPGGGRPLRDLLARALPEVDLVSVVARLMADAGQPFRPDDPLPEERAVDLRKLRNAERDQCSGRKHGIEELLARLEAEPVAPVDTDAVSRAQDAQEASHAWSRHDAAAERHAAQEADHARQELARADWRRHRDELGERPAGDDAGLRAALARQKAAGDAQSEANHRIVATTGDLRAAESNRDAHQSRTAESDPYVRAAADRVRVAHGRVEMARAKVLQLRAAGETCPTCERPGWPQAEAELERATNTLAGYEAKLRDCDTAYNRAIDAATAKIETDGTTAAGEVERLAVALDDARKAEATARGALDAARLAVEAERAALAVPEAWNRSLRALGPEPTVAGQPGIPPVPPPVLRPSSEDLFAARDLLDRAKAADGATKQRKRDEAEARSSLATAAEALDELAFECVRLDVLVDAVRRAPSIAARQQLAAFGDLGPVTIAFPSDGAAIEIAFDGRPWWLASTGRQIVCDAWFRAGIRRALRMPQLPIWIDRVQDVGGQDLPTLDGPVVLLRTTADGPLMARSVQAEAPQPNGEEVRK